ncbi:helix-turn-helix domain-containing protein [Deinococcus detaillensis]|uniref:Helix-turn-helix domain-containing protein n=1 Tax=Deinococcus detaillensis TaxID=2592048 RepID=A0A553UWX3_9DEIO|nr:excisionase family DNA-binding protein [Deinococcus detaillensis]TSA84704.1 helix-turn-helix domain-containing protein [Deinococcus detaillensis]
MTLHHTPSAAEQALAQAAQQLLSQAPLKLSRDVTLTPELTQLLSEILGQLGKGQSITVLSQDQELSTQAAADVLGVSRPYLIEQLLEGRKLPYRKVGKHRRIRLSDVLTYQQHDLAERQALAREITEIGQEIDPY